MARASRIVFCIFFVFLLALPVFAEETTPETYMRYEETMDPVFPSSPYSSVVVPDSLAMRGYFSNLQGYVYGKSSFRAVPSYPYTFSFQGTSSDRNIDRFMLDITFPFSPDRGKTYKFQYYIQFSNAQANTLSYGNAYPRLSKYDCLDPAFGSDYSTVALKGQNSSDGIFCSTTVTSTENWKSYVTYYVTSLVHFSDAFQDSSFDLSDYGYLDLFTMPAFTERTGQNFTVYFNPIEVIDDPGGGEYTGELVELIGQLIDIQTGARSDAESFQTDALSALSNIRNDLSGLTTGIDEGLAAAIEGANEQEKQELQNQYEDLVEQSNAGFTGLISSANLPAFVNVLTSFKNVLTYSGTQSVFTVPDLKIPSLYDSSGNVVVPATMLREGGVLNLTEMLSAWTEKIPWLNTLLTVFRAVVAISLIYFGFRCVMKIVNIDLKGLQHDLDSRSFWRW